MAMKLDKMTETETRAGDPEAGVGSVSIRLGSNSPGLPRNQELFTVAPLLICAFRSYGVDLSPPRRPSPFRSTLLLGLSILTVSLQILLLAIFVGFILFVLFNSGYMMVLYGTVPIVASGLSSFISFLNLKRKRKRILRFFRTLFLSLTEDFGISFSDIQSKTKGMERRAALSFAAAFILQLIQRVLIMVSPLPNDHLRNSLKNMTFIFPVKSDQIRPYVWIFQCVFIHVQIFDILTVCLLVIACRLALLPFGRIRERLSGRSKRSASYRMKDGPSPCTNDDEVTDSMASAAEFYRLHRKACYLVTEIESIFSSFLLTWCGTQTLTVCFWIRSIKVNTLKSHIFSLSVLLHLACTVTPFLIIAIIATRVNEQVLSVLKEFTQYLLFENDSKSGQHRKVTSNHILYLNYLSMHPVNLTGHGFFTLSRGFILTVGGTIITYTLVLYGID